ncbi:uncharacterized protein LOC120326186 [Styela clava]
MNQSISKTNQTLEHDIDKIFGEIQKSFNEKGDEKKRRGKLGKRKFVEMSIMKQWKSIDALNEQQIHNRKEVNRIFKDKSKQIFKKWKSELVENKLLAEKLKKESKKLSVLLHRLPDPDSNSETKSEKVHKHFINSQNYVNKSHKMQLKMEYTRLKKTHSKENK